MPHTRRKKKAPSHSKRQEFHDEDGWTRITRTSRHLTEIPGPDVPAIHQQVHNPLTQGPPNPPPGAKIKAHEPWTGQGLVHWYTELRIPPAPPEASLEKLRARYHELQKFWLGSESWDKLSAAIDLHRPREMDITKCVLLGTGSCCGYTRSWIARQDTALIQIAIFNSVVDTLEKLQGVRPPCYAQEPLYNPLDIEFLASVGITTVEDPDGFDLLSPSTFGYIPGAELDVTMWAQWRDTGLLLSGELDLYHRNSKGIAYSTRVSTPYYADGTEVEGETASSLRETADAADEASAAMCEKYAREHGHVSIPRLEMKDEPFFKEFLYYRLPSEPVSTPSDPTLP